MSQTAVMNTLRFANRLKEAGLANEQADALAYALEAELNGNAMINVVRGHEALAAEVRILKWAAGIALAFIFGAFAILYQGQATIIGMQSGLLERVTRVEEGVTSLEERVDGLDERMGGLEKRMDGFDKRMDGFDERMDGFDERMDGFDKRLGTIEDLLRILVAREGDTP